MDIIKAIDSVNNINDYTALSHDVIQCLYSDIRFNISAIYALKKIRSLEVQYFSIHYVNGAAFYIFEKMLNVSNSCPTWGLTGDELVSVLQYWCESFRTRLIARCHNWQIFLQTLLTFINGLNKKHATFGTILVQQMAGCLLDIACSNHLDLMQRYDVIKCLYYCSTKASPESRLALSEKFNGYLVKLSGYMATCPHYPSQLATLMLLLCWMKSRFDIDQKRAAADKWFKNAVHPDAVKIFIERSFRDFVDLRDFLNAHNANNDLITSAVCRKLSVGGVSIISGAVNVTNWIDVNQSIGTVTMVIGAAILRALNLTEREDVMTIAACKTDNVYLHRESKETVLSITMTEPPEFLNGAVTELVPDNAKTVQIHISSKADINKIDSALRRTFGDIYQNSLDDQGVSLQSSSQSNVDPAAIFSETDGEHRNPKSNESSTYPNTPNRPPLRKPWRAVKRIPRKFYSPSTTSTTSLLQLRERLENLPPSNNFKRTATVSREPELSVVSERTEPDDYYLSDQPTCTIKFMCKKFGKNVRKSQSDNEEAKAVTVVSSSESDDELISDSLLNNDSLLDCCDKSAINATIDCLQPKETSDSDLANRLIREVFPEKFGLNGNDQISDSGINIDCNKETQGADSEAIENTQLPSKTSILERPRLNRNKHIVNKSTSDESNTEPYIIEDTEVAKKAKAISTSDESTAEVSVNYVNVDRRKKSTKANYESDMNQSLNIHDKPAFTMDDIEEFFSQHINDDRDDAILVSPTLGRKINESSCESSDRFDKYIDSHNAVHSDVTSCMNDILNQVCDAVEQSEIGVAIYDQSDQSKAASSKQMKKTNHEQENRNTLKKQTRSNINQDKDAKKYISRNENELPKIKRKQKSTKDVKKEEQMRDHQSKKGKSSVAKKETDVNEKYKEAAKFVPGVAITKPVKLIYRTLKNDKEKNNNGDPTRDQIRSVSPEIDVLEKENLKEVTSKDTGNKMDERLSIRKKRKLYSPKDDAAIQRERPITEASQINEDEIIPLSELRNQTTIKDTRKDRSSCYKEIENEQNKRIRLPRKNIIQTKPSLVISPKTLKNDQLFEKLKEGIDNTNISLIEKNKITAEAVYNFSSDSDKDDFEKKKIEISKRLSATTLTSVDSRMNKKKIRAKKVQSTTTSTDEAVQNDVGKRKKMRPKIPRRKPTAKPVKDLENERMRKATSYDLNTSFIAEENKDEEKTDIEPTLHISPKLETVCDFALDDKVTEKRQSKNKKNGKSLLRKQKGAKNIQQGKLKIIKEIQAEQEIESPLPALIIETEPLPVKNYLASPTSINLVKQCNELIQGGNFLNSSQNLTTDIENVSFSTKQPDIPVEIEMHETNIDIETDSDAQLDKIKQKENSQEEILEQKPSKKFTKTVPKNRKEETKMRVKDKEQEKHEIYSDERPHDKSPPIKKTKLVKHRATSEISIETTAICKSPITAHGVISKQDMEAPPNLEDLNKSISPRNLEIQDMNSSTKKYFLQLKAEIEKNSYRNKTNSSSGEVQDEKRSTKSHNTSPRVVIKRLSNADLKRAIRSPSVSLTRLTDEEVGKWMPSPRSSTSSATIGQKSENSVRKTKKTSCLQENPANDENLDDPLSAIFTNPDIFDVTTNEPMQKISKRNLYTGSEITSKVKRTVQTKKNVISPVSSIVMKSTKKPDDPLKSDKFNNFKSNESIIIESDDEKSDESKPEEASPSKMKKVNLDTRSKLKMAALKVKRTEQTKKRISIISPVSSIVMKSTKKPDDPLKSDKFNDFKSNESIIIESDDEKSDETKPEEASPSKMKKVDLDTRSKLKMAALKVKRTEQTKKRISIISPVSSIVMKSTKKPDDPLKSDKFNDFKSNESIIIESDDEISHESKPEEASPSKMKKVDFDTRSKLKMAALKVKRTEQTKKRISPVSSIVTESTKKPDDPSDKFNNFKTNESIIIESDDEISNESKPEEASPSNNFKTNESIIIESDDEISNESKPEEASPSKRRKFETDKVVGIKSSNEMVRDWLNRHKDSSAGDDHTAGMEIVRNIQEKLETTLAENSRETHMNYAKVFLELQQLKHKQTEQIVEFLNKRNEEFDREFMRRTSDLLREVCKRNRAMVCLLKEDSEAVYRHLKRLERKDE